MDLMARLSNISESRLKPSTETASLLPDFATFKETASDLKIIIDSTGYKNASKLYTSFVSNSDMRRHTSFLLAIDQVLLDFGAKPGGLPSSDEDTASVLMSPESEFGLQLFKALSGKS
jgi:hypothetical protein